MTSYIIHHTSYIIHHTSYIIHHTSYIIHHTSYIIHHTSYYIIHHASLAGSGLADRPYGYFSVLVGIYLSLQITSIMQIFAFPKQSISAVVIPVQQVAGKGKLIRSDAFEAAKPLKNMLHADEDSDITVVPTTTTQHQ